MEILNTIKLKMTQEEKDTLKSTYRMLANLDGEDEWAIAYELGYDDLSQIKEFLIGLYELSGERIDNL